MKNLVKLFVLLVTLTALIVPQEKPNKDKRLIVLPDGKVMSGIDGSIISEKPERNFIKLNCRLDSPPIGIPFSWDNTLNFNSATFNSIYAIVVSGSDVYIGGDFTNAMFIGANYIIRWNQKNNTWHTVGVGNELNGPVRAIAVSGNDVYVGGEFTDAAGNLNSDYIARWDGNTWNSLGSGTGLNNFVNAIAISGSDVFIGGDFTAAGGLLGADHIVKWDGSTWNSMGQLDGSVRALTVSGSLVFIGGEFSSTSSAGFNYFASYDASNNVWGSDLGANLNGFVSAIAVSGSDLYIGGIFTNAGGDTSADAIAHYNFDSFSGWQALGNGIITNEGYDATVLSIAAIGNDLYVGGEFGQPFSSDFNHIAYWNGTSWDSLDAGLFGACRALALSGTDLLVGSDSSGFNRWFGAYAEGLFSALQLPAVSGSGLVEFNSLDDSTRISLNLVQSGYGNGIYDVFCYENKPVGGSILPVANHRWIIQASGLAVSHNFLDQIRIKFSDFPDSSGIINPNIVNIFYRPTPGRGNFSELFTTYDSNTNELWASINNVYGEYAIGLPNTVDGIISSNEYGLHEEGENMLTSDGKTWYMRSDDYYFYFGISNYTNENDAVNIYLDNSGISPVNYHDYYYGTQTGTGKDGLNTNLPFGAEFFAYLKPSYDEYRITNEIGGWIDSVANSFIKSYNDAGNIFEFAIPISSLPVSKNIYNYPLDWFNWLGFLSNSGNISSRVPSNPNPSGILNDLVWYFGADTYSPSFQINCYTHIGPSLPNFGAFDCHEFTFYPTDSTTFINRTSGVWNIQGDLWVYNGTLTFQNSDAVNVEGFLTAGGTTNFSYNTSDAPLNLKHFLWQWPLGGTIFMDSGHYLNFVPNLYGAIAIFQSNALYQNIVVNNPNKVYLRSDMKINESLTLLNGNIKTITYDTFYVRTIQGAAVTRPGSGYIEGYLVRWANNGIVDFPVGTSNGYSPVSFNFNNVSNPNTITVAAFQNVHPNAITPAQSMQRYWKIKKDSALTFTNTSINFQYLPEDFNIDFFELTDESTMVVGKYDASWSFPTITARDPGGNNDGGNITISGITSFSDFTMAKSETALPVELTSFTASVRNNSVLLNWTTATELNNYGFEIERTAQTSMASVLNETKWEKIGFVVGSGNSNSPKSYSFTDGSLIGGSKFKYRLKQIDNDGKFNYSHEINVEVVPTEFDLTQNYPNPFNPSTKIRYSIPDLGPGLAQTVLKVYDILGNEVATLVNEEKPAGVYEVEYNASNLSSGIYFYRITIQSDKADAGTFSEIKKMVLIK